MRLNVVKKNTIISLAGNMNILVQWQEKEDRVGVRMLALD